MTDEIAQTRVAFEDTRPGFWDKPSRSLLSALRIGRTPEGKVPDSAANARAAAIAMLIAFAIFAVFDSQGARHFTRDLPGNAFTDILVNAADEWHGLMVRLGPAEVGPAVRDRFEQVKHLGW
jgi:hypothetical protein